MNYINNLPIYTPAPRIPAPPRLPRSPRPGLPTRPVTTPDIDIDLSKYTKDIKARAQGVIYVFAVLDDRLAVTEKIARARKVIDSCTENPDWLTKRNSPASSTSLQASLKLYGSLRVGSGLTGTRVA